MKELCEMIQTADWKKEKHVPAIEVVGKAEKDQPITIDVNVGKDIAHPNTTEHHIEWIETFFLPEGEKFSYCIGRVNFGTHGASAQGLNTSTVYTEPRSSFVLKTSKPGTIYALSSCNIHGLWKNSIDISFS